MRPLYKHPEKLRVGFPEWIVCFALSEVRTVTFWAQLRQQALPKAFPKSYNPSNTTGTIALIKVTSLNTILQNPEIEIAAPDNSSNKTYTSSNPYRNLFKDYNDPFGRSPRHCGKLFKALELAPLLSRLRCGLGLRLSVHGDYSPRVHRTQSIRVP